MHRIYRRTHQKSLCEHGGAVLSVPALLARVGVAKERVFGPRRIVAVHMLCMKQQHERRAWGW